MPGQHHRPAFVYVIIQFCDDRIRVTRTPRSSTRKSRNTGGRVGRFVGATVKALLLLAATQGAWGQTSPVEYCQQIRTDDTLRTVPPSLVSAVVRLFQLEAMPLAQVERSTYFRCADGQVFVCTVGANLACGKAD